jgi:ubiquinone/menaquinone biosynthesis C-methylase UbiE
MTRAPLNQDNPKSDLDLGSKVVNRLLAVKPLAKFAKNQARSMMIKRAESIGVNWSAEAQALRDRGTEVWNQERQALENPNLDYPDYYLTSFHAYDEGNLSWNAATEVEVASYAAHARIWNLESNQGDERLRQTFHDFLQQEMAIAPQDILDVGCSVGMSTFALQNRYPQAQITGLDLSPYFLTVAQHRAQQEQRSITWIHRAAEQTGLPDSSFDLVSAFLICHELPQSATREILLEAKRLLRPQGYVAIMDMNPASDVFKTLPPYVFTLLKSTEPYLDDYFSLDLVDLLQDCGFQAPQIRNNSPRHRSLVAQVQS